MSAKCPTCGQSLPEMCRFPERTGYCDRPPDHLRHRHDESCPETRADHPGIWTCHPFRPAPATQEDRS